MTETISFHCDCGAKLKASASKIGKTFPCPKCRSLVTVPEKEPPPPIPGETIQFRCENCREKIHAPRKLSGKKFVCPHCGIAVKVAPSWVNVVAVVVAIVLGGSTYLAFGGWSSFGTTIGMHWNAILNGHGESVWVAASESDLQRMNRLDPEKDEVERLKMISDGRVEILPNGSEVKVLDLHDADAKVELLHGHLKGKRMFVDLKFIE